MTAKRPTVLLLDLGNVTVRLRFAEFFERLAAACVPRREAGELQAIFRDPSYRDYELGRIEGRVWHALLKARLGLALDYGAWLALWNDTFAPNAPMEALIRNLRGQVRVWGLSNTNADHLRFLRSAYPILGAFEGITASSEVGAQKPDAAIYGAALRSLGVEAPEVLYVDDIEAFVQSARSLGMQGFHYAYNDAELGETLRALGFSLPEA